MSLTAEQIKAIIAEKVTGKIEAAHDEHGHHYRWATGGETVDSVTTILATLNKPHLLHWAIEKGIEWLEQGDNWNGLKDPVSRRSFLLSAKTAHTNIRDDAGFVGTLAHEICEQYLKIQLDTGKWWTDIRDLFAPGADPRAIAAARAFEAWVWKHHVVPLASEILVGDPRYSAGTLDTLALVDNKLTLIDLKTSNQIDNISYPMQVAAYAEFFYRMTGLKIKQLKILLLSKDSDKFTVYKVKHVSQATASFKALCRVYGLIKQPAEYRIEKDIKKLIIK